ncbi:hypothetical protein EN912_18565, partial [Mesorhizobium sp. M7A.F.Ca.CA.004.02.1.1]
MPRAGGVYSAPPGTAGTPNTTIESAKYNALVADLVADANAARPLTAGGSGAATAVGGSDNFNAAGTNMASAATVNLANATGVAVTVTGTVAITAFGTVAAGAERVLTFAGILTLTHNATSLILPGAANITTAAGDVMTLRSLGSGNWACVGYQRANGGPVTIPAGTSISGPALVLEQSTTPAPTTEGRIQWDTDDNVIAVGDGAATQIFAPLPASTAAGDILYLSGAKAPARLAKGTAGQTLRMNAAATAPEWGGGAPDAIMEDQKASGINGGTFTSGAWRTRDLNTEVRDPYGLISLASNQFTPTVAGWVEWSAPACKIGVHQSRLFNVTDGVEVTAGTSEQTDNGNDFTQTRSIGGAPVVAGKTYRIEH